MIIIKKQTNMILCTMEKENSDSSHTERMPERISPSGATIASHTLLGQEGRVIITHQGEHYQLRQTRSGKLILTK